MGLPDDCDDYDEWFRRQVAAGITDLDAGECISHEVVMAEAREMEFDLSNDQPR